VDAAIDNGDNTIFVDDGTYIENIDVNKSHLTIKSENGAEATIVQALDSREGLFEIRRADYVKINGFTTKGSLSSGVGISLDHVNFCEISNNIISHNFFGIIIFNSGNSTLINNKMFDNDFNFSLSGGFDSHFDNNIDTTNTVDGKPIYYIQNANNQTYDSSTNAGTFYCISCKDITVKDLTLNKNGCGIFFWKTENSKIENIETSDNMYAISLSFSNNNTLADNTVSENMIGILFYYSDNNFLTNNIVSDSQYHEIYFVRSDSNTLTNNTILNGENGIYLYFSENNRIYHNNFINNRINSELVNSTDNFFDNGYPSGGNYWNDYAGVDLCKGPNQDQSGKDGIGDISYEIENSNTSEKVYDEYPFMEESGWKNPTDPYLSPEKYAPNLWFDSDESYYPIDPFFYVDDINKITGKTSQLNYLALPEEDKKKNRFTVFYHVAETEDETQWVYEYFFYYAYNEMPKINNHYHDWEAVFVFVNKETGEVVRVVSSAHHWYIPNNEFFNPNLGENKHIWNYIEQGGHAGSPDEIGDGYPSPTNAVFYKINFWGKNDRLNGYKVNYNNFNYSLKEITPDFISKFKGNESFPNSPRLGILCFKVPLFRKDQCVPIGGNPPTHPWIDDAYDNPEKIIPITTNYVKGKVQSKTQKLKNAIIAIFSKEPAFTFTNEEGEFLINNLPSGEHNIIVNLENYAPYKQRFIIEENENEENEIVVGVNGILNLIPENEAFKLKGTAKDSDGNIIVNSQINVYDKKGNKLFTTLTDEDGHYFFNLSSKNTYTVEVIQENKIEISENIKGAVGEELIVNLSIKNPKLLKLQSIEKLEQLKNDNHFINQKIDQIIKSIQSGLNEKYWIDDTYLEEKDFQGKRVFISELTAISKIESYLRIIKKNKNKNEIPENLSEILDEVSNNLAKSDFLLAETILNETKQEIESLETNRLNKEQKKLLKTINKTIKKAEQYLKQAKKQKLKKNYSRSVYCSLRTWNLVVSTKRVLGKF
jgi:parallel beta-helix repeat protein